MLDADGDSLTIAYLYGFEKGKDAALSAACAERDALRELLRESLEALTCGDTGDDLEDSHRCGRCDEYVDRNAKLRMKIRAALAQGQENKA